MILILLLSFVSSWGYSGHFAIGNLTMRLLPPQVQKKVLGLLLNDSSDTATGRPYEGSLGRASSWPDYIKRYNEYAWSKSIHYVDTNDNPPNACTYAVNDCKDGPYGCLISAIEHFYTNLGQDIEVDQSGGPLTRLTAVQGLKFFVHLVQDLHQPLHVCGKDRGGNSMKLKFGRRHTNLHSVWDGLMLNKRVQDDFKNKRQDWIDSLFNRIPVFTQICLEDCQPMECTENSVTCVKYWTTWINKLNCKRTWQFDDKLDLNDGGQMEIQQEVDLSTFYYKKNIGLMEDLIIAAAIRTAALITDKFK